MLEVSNLNVDYGGLHALCDVSISVAEGELVSIGGANGAGKSTLFKAISGTVAATGGKIAVDGQRIDRLAAAKRAHLGIAHVPEGRRVFASMTVIENIELGAYTAAGRKGWTRNLDLILDLFPILGERRSQLAGTLSGGQQQMLAIARGLSAAPRLLMLDEPSMGLSPVLADEIFETIQRIHREQGLTILLVEQRVGEALESCDRAYLLESGRIAASGNSTDLMRSDAVRSAYLGL